LADVRDDEMRGPGRKREFFWALAVQLWIAGVLATFFVVRVLESQTGQQVLKRMGFGHSR
jgi:hypothetical protein